MERRELLKLSGMAGAVVLIGIQPRHPVFATSAVHQGDEWEAVRWHRPQITYQVSDESIQAAAETGLDLLAEIKAAVRQETVFEIEQYWLARVRDQVPIAIFDQASDMTATFVGESHAKFVDMILEADPDANTAIVGPTALTLLQSSSCDRFQRTNSTIGSFQRCGTLDDRLAVICDGYCSDRGYTLVGTVPEADQDRKVAMVQINETEYAVAVKSDYAQGWRTIGLDVGTLSFL
jgi:hypothetical protein